MTTWTPWTSVYTYMYVFVRCAMGAKESGLLPGDSQILQFDPPAVPKHSELTRQITNAPYTYILLYRILKPILNFRRPKQRPR